MKYFLCFLLFPLHHCCLLHSSFMICPPNSSFIGQSLFYFFLQAMVCLIQNLKCQILFQHSLQYLYPLSYLYPYYKVLHFHHILVLHNHTKIYKLQFYLDLILTNLNKQAYSLIFEFFLFLLPIHFL